MGKTRVDKWQVSLFFYLVVLWGNRRRWWGYLRLSLCIPIIRGSVGLLVSSISTGSSCCCYCNWCRPSNGGCRGVGCCHRVCRHRCLMHSIAGHCRGVGVCYPSGRLLTVEERTRGLWQHWLLGVGHYTSINMTTGYYVVPWYGFCYTGD